MFFDQIKAQEGPVSILKRALEKGRVPTAYLFTGPSGCGRKMAALAVAAALNCREGARACGSCPSCLLYISGNHPDLHIIDVPEGKRQIGIEQVRQEVIEKSSLRPMSGDTSLFIVQDAHRMTPNASNAFLKTLEEPPSASHFILIAPDRDSVLPTISSRCQAIRFSPLPRQMIVEILVREGVSKETAPLLASMARGSAQKALEYHASGALEELAEEFKPLFGIHRLGAGQLLDLAQRWGRNRQDALDILAFMAQWFRDMIILGEGAPADQVIHSAHMEALGEGIKSIGGRKLAAILESVEDAREAIEANTNVQLTLDSLLLTVRSCTQPEEREPEWISHATTIR